MFVNPLKVQKNDNIHCEVTCRNKNIYTSKDNTGILFRDPRLNNPSIILEKFFRMRKV